MKKDGRDVCVGVNASSAGEGCTAQDAQLFMQGKSQQERSKATNCTSSQISRCAYSDKRPSDSTSDQERAGVGRGSPREASKQGSSTRGSSSLRCM